jgi:hypothetical protein
MDRKFLVLVAFVCGLVVVGALLVLPAYVWDLATAGNVSASRAERAIEHPTGGFVLLFGWLAAGLTGLVFMNKADILRMSEERHLSLAFLAFKLLAFFLLAWLIAGAPRGNFGIGYWLAFLASFLGTFAVYLTMNPALAQRIADATKAQDETTQAKPEEGGEEADGG